MVSFRRQAQGKRRHFSRRHAAKDMVTASHSTWPTPQASNASWLFVYADDAKTEIHPVRTAASTKQILLDPQETLLRR